MDKFFKQNSNFVIVRSRLTVIAGVCFGNRREGKDSFVVVSRGRRRPSTIRQLQGNGRGNDRKEQTNVIFKSERHETGGLRWALHFYVTYLTVVECRTSRCKRRYLCFSRENLLSSNTTRLIILVAIRTWCFIAVILQRKKKKKIGMIFIIFRVNCTSSRFH